MARDSRLSVSAICVPLAVRGPRHYSHIAWCYEEGVVIGHFGNEY